MLRAPPKNRESTLHESKTHSLRAFVPDLNKLCEQVLEILSYHSFLFSLHNSFLGVFINFDELDKHGPSRSRRSLPTSATSLSKSIQNIIWQAECISKINVYLTRLIEARAELKLPSLSFNNTASLQSLNRLANLCRIQI